MSGEDSSSGDGNRNGGLLAARCEFPQFTRLPLELREHIWCFYCPDLSHKSRVLEFSFALPHMRQAMLDRSDSIHLEIHPTVASQTKSLRIMLSTHRDSRRIAVRKYPDELVLPVVGSGRAIVRFRKETDVVYLMNLISDSNYVPPDFASEVQNLAVYAVHKLRDEHVPNEHETLPEVVLAIQGMFPNLKRLYNVWLVVFQPKDEISDESITKYVHQYMVETYGQKTGLEEDTRSLFCWPASHIRPDFSMGKVQTRRPPEEMEGIGLEVWSMVQFWSKRRYRTYNKLRRLYLNLPSANAGDDQDSSNSYDDDVTDSDDFESEGDDDDDGIDSDEFESEGVDDDDGTDSDESESEGIDDDDDVVELDG